MRKLTFTGGLTPYILTVNYVTHVNRSAGQHLAIWMITKMVCWTSLSKSKAFTTKSCTMSTMNVTSSQTPGNTQYIFQRMPMMTATASTGRDLGMAALKTWSLVCKKYKSP
jgi:hypothetical protein